MLNMGTESNNTVDIQGNKKPSIKVVNSDLTELVVNESANVKSTYPNSGKLSDYSVYIQDMDTDSKFFKISKMPNVFASGKNGFLIRGSSLLRPDSPVIVDIIDSQGNFVETTIPDVLVNGVDRLVVVNITPNNYYGDSIVTILGEAIDVPSPWKGTYNVKWQKRVLLNPTLDNDDDAIFIKNPEISFSEIYDVSGSVSKVNYNKEVYNQGLIYSKISGDSLSPLMSYQLIIKDGTEITSNKNFNGINGWNTSSLYTSYITASNNKLILSQSYGLFGITQGITQNFGMKANKIYTFYTTFNGTQSNLGGSVASATIYSGSNIILYLYTTSSSDVVLTGEFSSSVDMSASIELSGQAFAVNTVWSNTYITNLIQNNSGFGFTKEMEGGKLYISSSDITIYPNTDSYITASYETYIYKVINNTLAIANNSFKAYNTKLSDYKRVTFVSSSYNIIYDKKEYIGNDNVKNSYLKVYFKNLNTHVGSLKYIDLYKNPGNNYIGRYPIKAHDVLISGSEFSSSLDFTNNWSYVENGIYSIPNKSYIKKANLD